MDERSWGTRIRRALTAAVAVMAASFVALFVPIVVYAFVSACRARGAPDQAAINSFAATISPVLMPWFVRAGTLFASFWIVRRNAAARAIDGLVVGAAAGALSLAVSLAFGGRLDLRSLLLFLVAAGLGWLGGLAGRMMPRRRE